MLKIQLFGIGQASYAGQPIVGFSNQKSCMLLCYLLLNPHSHTRDKLATVFWKNLANRQSRKNLSQTLWRLRNALQSVDAFPDNYLLVDKDTITFDTDGDYLLDVEIFETTLSRYQNFSGRHLTLEQARDLENAVMLYTGDLLEGVYEDWCLYERTRLSLSYLDALGRLMIFHEYNTTYEKGLLYGHQILRYDNTREQVHQQMMRLHHLAGNQSAALAQYKLCCQILREELNRPPLEETIQLYKQILHHKFTPANDLNSQRNSALGPTIRLSEDASFKLTQTLQKISRLQTIISETSSELRSLENSIRILLVDSVDRNKMTE